MATSPRSNSGRQRLRWQLPRIGNRASFCHEWVSQKCARDADSKPQTGAFQPTGFSKLLSFLHFRIALACGRGPIGQAVRPVRLGGQTMSPFVLCVAALCRLAITPNAENDGSRRFLVTRLSRGFVEIQFGVILSCWRFRSMASASFISASPGASRIPEQAAMQISRSRSNSGTVAWRRSSRNSSCALAWDAA